MGAPQPHKQGGLGRVGQAQAWGPGLLLTQVSHMIWRIGPGQGQPWLAQARLTQLYSPSQGVSQEEVSQFFSKPTLSQPKGHVGGFE